MPSSTKSLAAVAISLVSCPHEQAETLARMLVEQQLAACVNILPQLRSIYRWQNQVEQADEALLLIKHPAANFAALRDAVLRAHPYELPEVLMVPVADGYGPYLDWVLTSCSA